MNQPRTDPDIERAKQEPLAVLSEWVSSKARPARVAIALKTLLAQAGGIVAKANELNVAQAQTIELLRAELASANAERDEARRTALAANVVDAWSWMPDGENHLASMGENMVVTMTAGTLRRLLAAERVRDLVDAVSNMKARCIGKADGVVLVPRSVYDGVVEAHAALEKP